MKKLLLSAMIVFLFSSVFQAPASATVQSGKTCIDFKTFMDVSEFWYVNGYSATNDPHDLDDDNDGYPCEVSKSNYDFFLQFVNGWKQVDGKWYFYMPGSSTPHKGWLKHLSTWYFLDANGVMITGWIQLGGTWYYLSGSGAMKTGWLWNGGAWYFLDQSGAMKTGWVKDNGKWYYLEKSGAMRTAPLQSGSIKYFFEPSGAMKTGWISLNNNWYYYGEHGPVKGWVLDNNVWYFLDQNGVMKTGWVYTGGAWYYLTNSGAMKTGWLQQGTTFYYLQPSGAMATGWKEIYNKLYYFYASGAMAKNTVIDGRELRADGAWIQDYLVQVQKVAAKYGLEVQVTPDSEYVLIDDVYEVAYGNSIGIIGADAGYVDVAIDLAIALGIPTSIDDLSDKVYRSIENNMDADFNEWKLDYVAEDHFVLLYWGEGLQYYPW